ncbi:MAG: hypothetical protein KGK07_13170 [Chloroflexota bacterium]|nr:hypothetical protein [Chloroflexota bacterium]
MAALTRWMSGGLAVAVAALFGASGGGAAHAQAAPTFVLSPQTQTVDLSAGTAQVQVKVQNATNVAAFGFRLRYDPGVLAQPAFQLGPFLASGGGFVQCQPPIIDGSGAGTISVGCFGGSGASGSGLLGTVTFQLAGGSSTAVLIEKDVLESADLTLKAPVCGTYIAPECAKQDGSITVTGGNPALDRGLQPTPTPIPSPVATTVPIGGAPVSATTPAPVGAADAGASPAGAAVAAPGGAASTGGGSAPGQAGAPSGTIAGASAGALSSGGGAGSGAPGSTGATVGSYGFGPPPPSHQHDRRDAIIAALALAALGLALLRAAAAVRPRM